MQSHGERDNPRLDALASATYVGCTPSTIYDAEAAGELHAIPNKSNDPAAPPKHIRTFLVSELQPMRQRWQQYNDGTYETKKGKRIQLTKVAKKTGLSYLTLLKELKELSKPKEQRNPKRLGILDDLNITPVEIRSPKNGRLALTILETEATSIRWAIKRALKKGKPRGYSQVSELATQLGLVRPMDRRQLGDSLKLWAKNQQLKSAPYLSKVPGKILVGKNKIPTKIKKLCLYPVYETKTAIQLWKELDAEVATKKLRSILSGGKPTSPYIHEQMHAAGFVDRLIHHALRQTKAVRHTSGRLGGPNVYELPRIPRKDAKKVIEDIMKDGPKLVSEARASLQEAGWSYLSPAVVKAVDELQITARCGPNRQQWWCQPGQKPPPSQRALQPGIQRVITFMQTHFADGEWHTPQEIVSAANEHGITKAQLYGAAPFIDGLERDTKKDGKWSSFWRLPPTNGTANGASSQAANGTTHTTEPAPKRRGRPKGAKGKKAAKRRSELLRRWDTGEFGDNVSAAARAFRIDVSTAHKILDSAGRL